jgi:hypothetical protein
MHLVCPGKWRGIWQWDSRERGGVKDANNGRRSTSKECGWRENARRSPWHGLEAEVAKMAVVSLARLYC